MSEDDISDKSKNWHSIKSLTESNQGMTYGGIKWDIHKNRKTLIEEGSMIVIGKRTLLHAPSYIESLKRRGKK